MACESEQSALKAAKTALNNIIKRDKINYFKTDSKVIKKAQQRVNDARASLYRCKNNVSKKKTGGCKKCGGMYQKGGFLSPPIEEI
jgi:hypothetical protein